VSRKSTLSAPLCTRLHILDVHRWNPRLRFRPRRFIRAEWGGANKGGLGLFFRGPLLLRAMGGSSPGVVAPRPSRGRPHSAFGGDGEFEEWQDGGDVEERVRECSPVPTGFTSRRRSTSEARHTPGAPRDCALPSGAMQRPWPSAPSSALGRDVGAPAAYPFRPRDCAPPSGAV